MPRQNVQIFNLSCDVLAADFSAPPRMKLAATFNRLTVAYDLVGIVLTSTLLNFGTQPLGVFFVIGQSTRILAYSDSLVSPVCSVTLQNSLTGPPAVPIPTTKTTPVPFSQPFPLNPRTPLSLYVFGDTTAGNRANAYLSIQVVRAGGS